jgi:hypothetical protein
LLKCGFYAIVGFGQFIPADKLQRIDGYVIDHDIFLF